MFQTRLDEAKKNLEYQNWLKQIRDWILSVGDRTAGIVSGPLGTLDSLDRKQKDIEVRWETRIIEYIN